MDASEIIDETPMLSAPYFQSNNRANSTSKAFSTKNRSSSMPIPMNSQDQDFSASLQNEKRTSSVQMSGPLYVNSNHEFVFQPPDLELALWQKTTEPKIEINPSIDRTDNNAKSHIYGVMNPHAKLVRQWNKFFLGSCFFACFLDPLFFFLLYVNQNNKCIVLSGTLTTTIVVLRSMTDFIYLIHILLQFRLAYFTPEYEVFGTQEDLVDDRKMIVRNYLLRDFAIDFLLVLPLPQIIILLILPYSLEAHGASYVKYHLLAFTVLIQYVPRLYKFLHLFAGSSPKGYFSENFGINLLLIFLISYMVGSYWYLFGLQRVHQCFRDACRNSNITRCTDFIDCGKFENDVAWGLWRTNENATACLRKGGFEFGIYENAVILTTHESIVTRCVYSLFWGFQQISTLAGNQVPSYLLLEVIFTMTIIAMGLALFALLIGNMQKFLEALGRRRLEKSLRQHEIEQWMTHHGLPQELRRKVRASERLNWDVTKGINGQMLMEYLPEDLQKEIRRHIFKILKQVNGFQQLDEPIMDAICERLRTKTYIRGSKILCKGGLVDKMVFIIRGKMESIGEDLIVVPLSEGDVCGEELLAWCLEHSSANKGPRLLSNRLVRCLTNVQVFVLQAVDLEEVTSLFPSFFGSPRVQGLIRYKWRGLAPRRTQVAWRYKKKRISHASTKSTVLHE